MDLRYGSADENVRKRSILDIILHERQRFEGGREKITGASLPESKDHTGCRSVSEAALLSPSRAGELAVISTVNRLAAEGIRAKIFLPVILLPPGTQEEVLRELMRQICRTCFADEIEIGQVRAEVTDAVTRPIVIGTAEGDRFCEDTSSIENFAEDFTEREIVVTGPVGLEGTYILVCQEFKALQERFPMSILTRMRGAGTELSVLRAAGTAAGAQDICGLPAMVSLGQGGFFAGLWELSRKTGCGLEADLQAVPILQETIEITDFCGINPYTMRSGGSLLIAVRQADQLIRRLEQDGRTAVKIGKLTGTKDKIIRNGEDVRFLDRPQTDSLALAKMQKTGFKTLNSKC